MFGDKQFKGVGFPTPLSIPDETVCRTIHIPASGEWEALVMGCLYELCVEGKWQQFEGAITREEAAARAQVMFEDMYENVDCPSGIVEAPYWDDAEDVDDSLPADEQPWYGTVSDPEAPPDELDFVENAAVWIFTGFLAVATLEIGAAPAILFHTIAPKFLLATKRGDIGEIIRILVDGEEAARVDTSGYAAGDIIRTPIVADPSITTGHDIMLVQVS